MNGFVGGFGEAQSGALGKAIIARTTRHRRSICVFQHDLPINIQA